MTAARRPVQPDDLLRIKTVTDVQIAPDGRRIAFVVTELDAESDEIRSRIWLVSADGGPTRPLTYGPGRDSAPRWSPDGRFLAFLSDRPGRAGDRPQLYVLPMDGGEPRRLTDLERGAGPAVWSPDGQMLLFAARVAKEAAPSDAEARRRWEQRPRVVTRAHYKDDGSGYTFDAASQLFVVPLDGGPPRQITSGEASSREPAWSPDGRRVAFVRTRTGPADYNLTDLWVCDADGGNTQRLTDDVGRAAAPAWSPDGRTIACYGTDTQVPTLGGEMTRVWLVPAEGGPPRNLTAAYDRSPYATPAGPPAPPVWSPDGATLTLLVADAGDVHAVRITVESGAVEPLITGERQVTWLSAVPGGPIAFAAHDPLTPGDVFVCRWDGVEERRLTDLNGALLAELALPRVERRQFRSPNGGEIEGWLVHPLDGRRPAPLLVHIHGGPHSFSGNAFKMSSFYEYVLAGRGWATLALNPSGSGSYGRDFMRSLLGRWGEYDLPEQLAAIDQLVAEGIADPERLAVTGYSYGGYMTAWVVGHTDRFKAAVVGAPVTNLESFFGTSDIGMWFGPGEMLGDIFTARDTYRRLSPVQYVDRVTTPTLILHGEADDRCPIGQGEEFYIGLVAAGRAPCEFVRYPGASHLFLGQGRPSHRVDYCRRVVAWVERYTRGAPAPEHAATAAPADD